MRLGQTDSVLGAAPLFHIAGMVAHLAVAMTAGLPLVHFYRFDPLEALRAIQRWRPTMTVAAITAFLSLRNVSDVKRSDLSSLSRCYSGGAPIAPSIVERFEEQFGVVGLRDDYRGETVKAFVAL